MLFSKPSCSFLHSVKLKILLLIFAVAFFTHLSEIIDFPKMQIHSPFLRFGLCEKNMWKLTLKFFFAVKKQPFPTLPVRFCSLFGGVVKKLSNDMPKNSQTQKALDFYMAST
jgi:hypothetical protein